MSFKSFVSIVVSVFILMGCEGLAPKREVKVVMPTEALDYQGPTNPELIMMACNNLQLGFLNEGKINTHDKILISSLEYPADTERINFPVNEVDPLAALMEDVLTKLVTEKGHHTVERDLDVLTRIYHETGSKYLISITPDFSPSKMMEEMLSLALSLKEGIHIGDIQGIIEWAYDYMDTNARFARSPFFGEETLQNKRTIDAADYVLSFRILECGVRKRPILVKYNDVYPQVERIAVVKLHLRLTTKSSVTVWSDIVESIITEPTPVAVLNYHENSMPEFYGYTLPLYESVQKTIEQDKKKRGSFLSRTIESFNPNAGKPEKVKK